MLLSSLHVECVAGVEISVRGLRRPRALTNHRCWWGGRPASGVLILSLQQFFRVPPERHDLNSTPRGRIFWNGTPTVAGGFTFALVAHTLIPSASN